MGVAGHSLHPQFEGRGRELQACHPDVHAHDGGCLHLVGAVGSLEEKDVFHKVILPLHLQENPTNVTKTNHPLWGVFVGIGLGREESHWKVTATSIHPFPSSPSPYSLSPYL